MDPSFTTCLLISRCLAISLHQAAARLYSRGGCGGCGGPLRPSCGGTRPAAPPRGRPARRRTARTSRRRRRRRRRGRGCPAPGRGRGSSPGSARGAPGGGCPPVHGRGCRLPSCWDKRWGCKTTEKHQRSSSVPKTPTCAQISYPSQRVTKAT